MSSVRHKRRLAAILAADLVGFVRHMQRGEDRAIAILADHQKHMLSIANRFGGRLVDAPGDFLLSEFYSARDAIEAALTFRELVASDASGGQPAQYRFGIDLGDVFDIGQTVHGNAVNVAARLQQNATPGQILISHVVFEVVRYQGELRLDLVGTRRFKNVQDPVRVFAVSRLDRTLGESTSVAPLPDHRELRLRRPIVQVVRFTTSGSDADSSFLAKALHNEILATLEPLRHVITVQENMDDGEEGDFYRLDGTFHSGGTIRIIPCLTKVSNGKIIWASRYSYEQHECFDAFLQIASEVVAALQINLTEGEQAELWRARTASLEAWECFQRAHHLERRYRSELHRRAVTLYERALALDGGYVVAITALGFCLLDQVRLGWVSDVAANLDRAEALAARAWEMDQQFPDAIALKAFVQLLRGETEQALATIRDAIELAPQSVEITAYYGSMLRYLGRAEEAIGAYRRAQGMCLHPAPWLLVNLGNAHLDRDDLFEASAAFTQVVNAYPDHLRAHLGLAIAAVRSGDMDEAHRAVMAALRIEPGFAARDYTSGRSHSDPRNAEALIDDLVRAGLPRERRTPRPDRLSGSGRA
jgi:adenylate cyclase